jgi:hypothetical protein
MAERAPVDQNYLADLVERRIEAPHVEYKRWMPLSDNVERANIARHLCALANGGGGWLVFGFEDDGTESEPHPGSLAAYGQDAINGIAERYLAPQPHCETHHVTAASGRIYPVIRVPSHEETPVCAKRGGPQDDKGQPRGISEGVHYVRAAGPRSVPINTPELWRPVLHRCLLAGRGALLASINQLLDRPAPALEAPDPLGPWLDQALADWSASAPSVWPVDTAANRAAFAFRLLDASGGPPAPLGVEALRRAIQDASFRSAHAAGDGAAFDSGWDVSQRAQVILVDDREALQTRLAPDAENRYLLPLLWRISLDGAGVEIAAFAEDNPWVQERVETQSSRKWPPGQRLSPNFQIDVTVQRLDFVLKLAEHFPDATQCELAVDYLGLAGRTIGEPSPGISFSITRTSAMNARRQRIRVGPAALAAELPEATAALVGPIFRLFDGWEVGPDYVRARLTGA